MFFQSCETISEKTLAPKGDYFAARIQTRSDLIVGHAFGRVEDHLGPLDLKIRQRIFCRTPA
jgi:hypothetical protein